MKGMEKDIKNEQVSDGGEKNLNKQWKLGERGMTEKLVTGKST